MLPSRSCTGDFVPALSSWTLIFDRSGVLMPAEDCTVAVTCFSTASFEQSQTERPTPGLSPEKHPRNVTSNFSNLCSAPSLSSVICSISRL